MTIITHAGEAHRDDFLTVCLAITLEGHQTVIRADPAPSELESPDILVVDVGERHEPAKSNFDHHQRGRVEAPECALSLWARTVEYKGIPLTDLLKLTLWFEPTVRMDVLGPFAVAREMGITPDQVFSLGSPIERSLLALFGEGGATHVDEALIGIMRQIGRNLLSSLHAQYEGVEKIRDVRQMFNADHIEVTVLEMEDTQGLATLRRLEGADGGVGVSYDDRGDGWSLLRFQDDPRVDFSKIKDHPAILFAHPGGFIAKTQERISIHDVLALIKKSLH